MRVNQLTGPSFQAVSLEDVKAYLRIDGSTEDALIESLITASAELAESHIESSILRQKWEIWLDGIPAPMRDKWWNGTRQAHINTLWGEPRFIELPRGPVFEVDDFFFFDTSDTQQSYDLDKVFLDKSVNVARLTLKFNETWPINLRHTSSINIQYKTGAATTTAEVPASFQEAVKLIIGNLYENRGDQGESFEIPSTAKMLLQKFKTERLK